jgi:hypothetical protein
MEKDVIEWFITKDRDGRPQMMRNENEALTHEADLAIALVRGYGLIAARPSGEANPDGSQKLEVLSPEEAVTRACQIARLTFDNLRAMGWIVEGPSIHDVYGKGKGDETKAD